MITELINTGSELLLGRVLNTHQQWICRQLADNGYSVQRQVAVPDGGDAIQQAVREGLERADLVITTGGLGPTCDDLTRDRIAELLGRPLQFNAAIETHIRHFFESRGRPVPVRTRVETHVPAGADVWMNAHGTAPGLAMEVPGDSIRPGGRPSRLVLLPGPPRELRPMFLQQALPAIRRWFPHEDPFVCRTLKTTGLGESLMEERISGPLQPLIAAGLDLGFCARVGEVDVRFTARGASAGAQVAEAEAITRRLVGDTIFGEQDDRLEEVLIREFASQGRTLAIAESCTGGHLADRLTNVPGASAVLLAGFVTYANKAKIDILHVPESLFAAHGAVSEPVARAMAEGARRVMGADYAVATTGVAGPGGGTADKPVGTVYIAIAGPLGTEVQRRLNTFDRETFKFTTCQQAMALLRFHARPVSSRESSTTL